MTGEIRTRQQQIGDQGEDLVCRHLQQQGWQILAQQWRCRWGELDIVAHQGSTLAFVEVKTRTQINWDQGGRLAITAGKQRKLIRAAMTFLSRFPDLAELDCRFDVALIRHPVASGSSLSPELEYIPAAFDLS